MNPRILIGVGVGIIIFPIIQLIPFILVLLGVISLFTSLCLGTILWAAIYFGLVFPSVSFIVPADRAYMMSNSFIQESSERLTAFSGYREIKAQTEYQAGFYWRYPWETLSHDVDMQRRIIIQEDPERVYTFKDGKKTIRIEWQVVVTPLPGSIQNYIKTREEDIIVKVKARVQKFIQGHIGGMDNADFGDIGQEKFKAAFEKVFKGPTEIDDIDERPLGIWTGTPEIVDIDEPKEVQKGRNIQQVIEALTQAAMDMVVKSGNTIDFDKAIRAAYVVYAAENGGGEINIVELTGKLFGGR